MKRIVKIPVWVEPIEVEIECEGTEDDEMLIDKALVIAEEEHEKVPWEFDRDAFCKQSGKERFGGVLCHCTIIA